MALAQKYQNRPEFLEISSTADQAVREIAEAFGVLEVVENKFETAAGNVVDDICRLILVAIEKKASKP